MRTYEFRDEWQVEAPPEQVWDLISRPASYPEWWPIYRRAEVLKDTSGVGSEARLTFKVLLPYSLTITTRTTRSEPPRVAEGTVTGELDGTWRWTLQPHATGTRVIFEETVSTNKWILNLLAPIAHRLFALNHRIAAERGAAGMKAFLAREAASRQEHAD
ncbi:SRPBCC family protein [Aurantimonas sp. VKM B-3413]|uniref:SRPBCC family protein n=1 Tax=Aurantimonas sp. VKM B-3413 TaxID=2779401 RepID=UPI001E51AC68|nr:SRPBCC family protein [Aurantimonas sp. VKM B-3413]